MDAQEFKELFDEDGYVILRDFIPLELMNNARLALGRIVDALAEERVANGDIPHAFKDEPFELQFKKLFKNEPESGVIQFTSELPQPEFYDLHTYRRMFELAQSYLGDELRVIFYVVRMRAFPNSRMRVHGIRMPVILAQGWDDQSHLMRHILNFGI